MSDGSGSGQRRTRRSTRAATARCSAATSSQSTSRRRWSAPSSTTRCRSSRRARLPDVRDGLKPVQRRILYAMHDLGLRPDRPRMKSARVSGEVMGKFHPHGEGSIYDALVRMAQPFALRDPLIDFHGNYGSPDFSAAASRYTEVRLAALASEMLAEYRREHRRLRAELHQRVPRADRSPQPLPQPVGQRQPGHRRRHGHQHPAPQPGRGHRRGRPPHRQSQRHARRSHGVRQGSRLPHRRADPRPGRHHRRVPHRTRLDPHAGPRRDRRDQDRRADRRHRAAVPVEHEHDHHAHRRAGERARARRHPQRRRPLGGRRHQAGDRPQARRQRQRRPQQPVQADRAADQLRREHGGAGRRRASHAQPGAGVAGLHRAPGRRHHPAVAVPPRAEAGAGAHRRRPASRRSTRSTPSSS